MNISGYVIEKQIGKGGMAMVYRAAQESLGRPVALKVMNPLFSDSPEFSERFLDEGRLLAAVQHSNIITIHDSRFTILASAMASTSYHWNMSKVGNSAIRSKKA